MARRMSGLCTGQSISSVHIMHPVLDSFFCRRRAPGSILLAWESLFCSYTCFAFTAAPWVAFMEFPEYTTREDKVTTMSW